MSDQKESARLKLRIKLDRPMHALLDGKNWTRFWNFCQKYNINYYLHHGLGRLIKKIGKIFGKESPKLADFNLYAIGQSHIDACWLWTKLSTMRRCIITAQQAIRHFEKYPYFTYSQTTPQYYEWIKRLRPDLFKKIQEYEKKGKWELVGGMWVEPDVNVPNGESLVRQRLYGQLFFLENFGKIATIECLEDTFGFNAQLPQILTKSGAEAFWTTKITWNDYTEFPFANFIWRGIDGSEIFTHMFLFNWLVLFDLSLYTRTGRKIKEKELIFNSSMNLDDINSNLSNEKLKTLGIFYGFGDGGMGPLKEEIDIMTNIGRRGLLKFCSTKQYFDILRKECGDILPIWDDELYLELHRGVYTTQANIKRLNRAGEINLRNCEIILTLFTLFFKYFEYPESKMKKLWKDLLFNQFHDILPGSSIQDVYYEQEKELENIVEVSNHYISVALKYILLSYLKKRNQLGNAEDFGVVINTLPWRRDGYIHVSKKNSIYIENIPSLSFRIINMKEMLNSKKDNEKDKETDLKLENNHNKIILENSKLKLTIKKLTGKVISIRIKQSDAFKEPERELIQKNNGIGVHIFEEKKYKYPAWEIYKNYTSYPINIGIVKGIQIVEDSLETKTIKLFYKYKNTMIQHYITLRNDSDLIEFKTDIDANDEWLLFKTRFPFELDTNLLTGEIAYGNIKRKLIPETEMEKGKWEFPAQKYVDISEEDFGITIINKSKYGFSITNKGLYLTLLHTPLRPHSPFFSHLDLVPKEERTKYVDIGFHSIEYAIWIHHGDFVSSAAWEKGYEYNYPLIFERYEKELPSLPEFFDIEINERFKNIIRDEFSVVSVSNQNIILQVIKLPEKIILESSQNKIQCDENNAILIIRLFETAGNSQNDVEIEFDNVFRINKVIEVDLLEREINNDAEKNIVIKDRRKLILNFKKFEIKTIKFCVSL